MRCAPGEELLDEEARRLLWRCRRGMKELDVLLERYVRSRLSEASSEERQALARLLELPDPVLSDYLFGHAAAPEPPLAALVAAIRGWTPVQANVGPGPRSVGPGPRSVGQYR
jgi:antitoxin CptB